MPEYLAFFGGRRFVTPGREAEDEVGVKAASATGSRAEGFVIALGGAGNLIEVGACTTRLRLIIADQDKVDAAALKILGSRGMIRPTPDALQVVLGPIADQVAGEMRAYLKRPGASPTILSTSEPVKAASISLDVTALGVALGGADNIKTVEARSTRLLIDLNDAAKIEDDAFKSLGVRGVVKTGLGRIQVLIGPEAEAVAKALSLQMKEIA